MPPTKKAEPSVVETTAVVHEPMPSAEPALTALQIKDLEDSAVKAFVPEAGDETPMALPRIKLLQALTREVSDEDNPQPVGTFLNTLSGENLGKAFEFIILSRYPQRLRMQLGVGLVCRSTDMHHAQLMGGTTSEGEPTNDCNLCVAKLWPRERIAAGEKLTPDIAKKGPECSIVENFPALLVNGDRPEDYELILNSYSRTSIAAARKLIGLYRSTPNKPWYNFVYKNYAVKAPGPGNAVYYKQEIARVRSTTPAEQVAVQEMLRFFKADQINTDNLEEELNDVPAAATAGATSTREDF